MRKLIKASASAKRRASQRTNAIKCGYHDNDGQGWLWDNPETNSYSFDYRGNSYNYDKNKVQYDANGVGTITPYKTLDECLNGVIEVVGLDNIISENVEITKVNSAGYIIERWDSSEVYDLACGAVNASTNVKADLQLNKNNKRKYNWGKNPITDLDGYVKDIADGVVERFPNVTYEISDEAITFTDENNNIIYVQPIDEIVPEKEDLDNDILELGDAVQNEFENADWYSQASEEDEDDPDYASRAVTL